MLNTKPPTTVVCRGHFNGKQLSHTTTQLNSTQSLIARLWKKWKKEYVINLRDYQKKALPKKSDSIIEVDDVIITEEDNLPRLSWSLGNVEGAIKRDDGQVCTTKMKVAKTKAVVQRPLN